MTTNRKIILSLIFGGLLWIQSPAHADYDFSADKNKQAFYIKSDIAGIEGIIMKNDALLFEYRNELEGYNMELLMLAGLFQAVEGDEIEDKDELMIQEMEVQKYRENIQPLKDNFQKKIIWLYKYGSNYDAEVLFTSESLSDMYLRLEYLDKISDIRKKEFEKIKQNQFVLEEKKKLLNLRVRERLNYISKKKDDQRTLYEKKLFVESLIATLEKENENYTRQMERMQAELNSIESRLTNLRDNFIYKIDQTVDYNGTPFAELKRKLILPVNSVDITEDFGTSVNPNTLTVTYNNGIDVSIARGSEVRAVADGVIEDVKFIPAYGDVMIIDHGDGYRTAYAILQDVRVEKGVEVKGGEVIASTSDNIGGQGFHFELWKDKQPLNPKFWFKRS